MANAQFLRAPSPSRVVPNVAANLEEFGIPASMVADLVLRLVRERGTTSFTSVRKALKLPFGVMDAIFQQLKQQQLLDVKGNIGQDYFFSLTTAGHALAAEKADICRYAGPAPVALELYARVVRSQRVALCPTVEDLARALGELVVSKETIDELGVALTSGKPIFLYGPSGNGKTSIIERLPRLFDDTILVPYCVEVDGHIISVFDPAVHVPLELDPDETVDQRWIRCYRPTVTAGGELVPELLSLRLDETTGLYAAPLQMKAANGIFAIDDFGRQTMTPRELFNRWIMPLDRRVEHLALRYGYTFAVPFEVILMFSTNMEPSDLADEAFFRRVPNKVFLGAVGPDIFDEIFNRALALRELPSHPELGPYLRELCRTAGVALRACQPGDICDILLSQAAYEREPVAVTRQNLARATHLYFVQTASGQLGN